MPCTSAAPVSPSRAISLWVPPPSALRGPSPASEEGELPRPRRVSGRRSPLLGARWPVSPWSRGLILPRSRAAPATNGDRRRPSSAPAAQGGRPVPSMLPLPRRVVGAKDVPLVPGDSSARPSHAPLLSPVKSGAAMCGGQGGRGGGPSVTPGGGHWPEPDGRGRSEQGHSPSGVRSRVNEGPNFPHQCTRPIVPSQCGDTGESSKARRPRGGQRRANQRGGRGPRN